MTEQIFIDSVLWNLNHAGNFDFIRAVRQRKQSCQSNNCEGFMICRKSEIPQRRLLLLLDRASNDDCYGAEQIFSAIVRFWKSGNVEEYGEAKIIY